MFAAKEKTGIIIAGGGWFGNCLAEQLNGVDETLSIIDINPKSFDQLAPAYAGITVEGDASNIEILRAAGISQARVAIAVTNDDNVNLMISRIAREIYETPIVIAVVKDQKIMAAKDQFDFSILCPSLVMAQAVIQELNTKAG